MLRRLLNTFTPMSLAERQSEREFDALWQKLSIVRRTFYHAAPWVNRHFPTTKATRREIATLEQRLGCELPTEYRRWLLEVGHGAFGPGKYDRLIGPDELIREADWYLANPVEPYAGEEFRDVSELTHERFAARTAWPTIASYRGSLCICAYRDSVDHRIVVTGPLRGCVIQELIYIGAEVDAAGDLVEIAPGSVQRRVRTFNQFIDRCLSQSIKDAPNIVNR